MQGKHKKVTKVVSPVKKYRENLSSPFTLLAWQTKINTCTNSVDPDEIWIYMFAISFLIID